MKSQLYIRLFFVLATMAFGAVNAQNNTTKSVLSEHTWYRFSVTEDGIYKLNYQDFQNLGIDMQLLNPNHIRIFGNEAGLLSEKCGDPRYDDLSELALQVVGAEDGRFDTDDYVLFYGQHPSKWVLGQRRDTIDRVPTVSEQYDIERNYYSDSTYYFLCVNSGEEGRRIGHRASATVQNATTVITEFRDYAYHEVELMTPFFSGRNWYGEQLTSGDPVISFEQVLPDLVKSKELKMNARVMGRTSGNMYFSVKVNDNILQDKVQIVKPGDVSYGIEKTFARMFFSDSDTLTIRFEMTPDVIGSTLFIDYFQLNFWRHLKRVGDYYPFRITPDQYGEGDYSTVWVQNVPLHFVLWDVTQPLSPYEQEYSNTGGNMLFVTEEKIEKRYVLFDVQAVKSVSSFRLIRNQNLHGIDDADMLIFTHDKFVAQAQELADFHTQVDGMKCVVVNVEDVFNEFSTGMPDPTGMRDFIRMVYRRTGSRLGYVTLFGKASADFRDIKGLGQNYVPCYEALPFSCQETESYCSDDYFGLMGANDGPACAGYLDIAVGRIPVSTTEQADVVLRKIKHYHDNASTHGRWKNELLLAADDDAHTCDYAKSANLCAKIMDTMFHVMNQTKLFLDEYPPTPTVSGNIHPEANAELMRRFEKGVFAMFYLGHGGVTGLTQEQFFTNTDIQTMTNYDKLPFVFTGTCQFSKFDSPLLVSAGERMFLQPEGGAIALLTTTRSTYPGPNTKIGKSLAQEIFKRDGNKGCRIGDIVKLSKVMHSYDLLNRCYVLFGDPALRLAYPNFDIRTTKVNGISAAAHLNIHAMSKVEIRGEVLDATGNCDSLFNGTVSYKFYDKRNKHTSTEVGHLGSFSFEYYDKVLCEGIATVANGKFEFVFQVPYEINYSYGEPRLSYYAYDTVRHIDANGVFENWSLGGVQQDMADHNGPEIEFYYETPAFSNGDTMPSQGVLYAHLFDEQGIYHYDFSIGRDILLNGNANGFTNRILNDYYEPALDDYQRGSIAFPIVDLPEGVYDFTIRAWDTQNNSSEASLWFVVGRGVVESPFAVTNIGNFPNPFSNETFFTFVPMGQDGDLDVVVEIYNTLGQYISGFETTVVASGGRIDPIRWRGTDINGNLLGSGIYVYKITTRDAEGHVSTSAQRMMIVR